MAMRVEDSKIEEILEAVLASGLDGLGKAVEILLNQAMLIERQKYLQAEPYERTGQRTAYANGFKPKQLKHSLGELALQIPQTRDGGFYPSFLEKGLRSERAFKQAMAEMYVQGVSTRKVTAIIEELCGFEVSHDQVSRATKLLDEELSKWRNRPLGKYAYLFLDARYEKVRRDGCVQDSAVLIAYGVNEKGMREILGISVAFSEAEVHWRAFFESLVTRGLSGLKCVISDAHSGLKSALTAVFPSVRWQRCQFHLQQNAQSHIPKQSMRKEVAHEIKGIFDAPSLEEANRLLKLLVIKYEKSVPELSQWLEKNVPESLTVFHFPMLHRRRLRTSNLAERVNKEIRRRTRVITIFPNTDSCLRLVTAIISEISEEWETGKVYLSMDE